MVEYPKNFRGLNWRITPRSNIGLIVCLFDKHRVGPDPWLSGSRWHAVGVMGRGRRGKREWQGKGRRVCFHCCLWICHQTVTALSLPLAFLSHWTKFQNARIQQRQPDSFSTEKSAFHSHSFLPPTWPLASSRGCEDTGSMVWKFSAVPRHSASSLSPTGSC